jgi:hypothetical protein
MSIIAAGTTTTTALSSTGNTDGTLQFQVNGTTASVTLNTLGAIGVGSSPSYGSSGNVLISGGSTAAPAWGTAGTSTTATNLAGGVAGAVPYQSGVGTTGFSAAGTSGQPVVSGGTGAPTFRPYTLPASDGSANQVLQTNGSGALSFATPATGAMTLISTQTASSSANITWSGLSGYNQYMLVFTNLLSASTTATLNFVFGTGAGPTFITANYTEMVIRGFGGTPQGDGGVSRAAGYLANQGSNTTQRLSGFAMINGMTSLAQVSFTSNWQTTTVNTVGAGTNWAQVATGGVAITAIKINFGTGNITSGTASLYGISS